MVNLFHVNKVSENWKVIQLKSDSEIPLSINGRKKFIKEFYFLSANIGI
jgi:hypothetical protein